MRPEAAPRAPLPCLSSNNSIERTPEEEVQPWNILKGNHKKTAHLLAAHVERMVSLYGLQQVGMLTLTFADHVTDAREAQRRMNSLLTNVIRSRYRDYICVIERTARRRIHFHLLVPVGSDIRTGVDFAAIEDRDYRTAGKVLRSEWSFWRLTAPKYGFGRTELLPVKSTERAVALYVGKYISKHIDSRREDDKGVRLVRTSFNTKAGTTRFAWNTAGFRLWREKVGAIAQVCGIEDQEGIHKALGRRWAYRHQDIIQATTLPIYWSKEALDLDGGPTTGEAVMRLYREFGLFRFSPEEAALAIGQRETEPDRELGELVFIPFDEEEATAPHTNQTGEGLAGRQVE